MAREAREAEDRDREAAHVYASRLVVSILKKQIVHAHGSAERFRPQVHFHIHYDTCLKHEVEIEAVPWKSLPRLPPTFKECTRRARNFVPNALSLSIPDAFQAWQSVWRFSRRTLSELAKEVDADLSSDMQRDLRRTATWASSSHRGAEHTVDLVRATTWPKVSRMQQIKIPSKRTVKRELIQEQIKTPSDHQCQVSRW